MTLEFPSALHCLIYLHVRGPQGEVVTKKLHDQGAILVGLLPKSIQFRDGFIEGLEPSIKQFKTMNYLDINHMDRLLAPKLYWIVNSTSERLLHA